MPIEICGTTRERTRQEKQQQQLQQQVGHKQVLSVFFMTSSAHFFLLFVTLAPEQS